MAKIIMITLVTFSLATIFIISVAGKPMEPNKVWYRCHECDDYDKCFKFPSWNSKFCSGNKACFTYVEPNNAKHVKRGCLNKGNPTKMNSTAHIWIYCKENYCNDNIKFVFPDLVEKKPFYGFHTAPEYF